MTSTLIVRPASRPPGPAGSAARLSRSFPNSTKVYVEGPRGVRVPMREIALSGGEPPLRVYDTSGPQGCDVREGLPSLRGEWICSAGCHGTSALRLRQVRGSSPRSNPPIPRAPRIARRCARSQ